MLILSFSVLRSVWRWPHTPQRQVWLLRGSRRERKLLCVRSGSFYSAYNTCNTKPAVSSAPARRSGACRREIMQHLSLSLHAHKQKIHSISHYLASPVSRHWAGSPLAARIPPVTIIEMKAFFSFTFNSLSSKQKIKQINRAWAVTDLNSALWL